MMVAKDSPIKTAEDLDGKVVALNGLNNITQVGAEAWIAKNGGDPDSVRFIELPFPQMGAALAEGRADAAIVAEPALTQAKSEARVLGDAYSAIADRFLITAYFATDDWVEENPEVAEKFATAIQKAGKWANENPEESARILEKYTKISTETASKMTRAVNGESFEPALIRPPLESARKFGILKKPLDADKLLPGKAQSK
jgi:NitT/TauT family transport system substrate-binding protein